MEISWQQAKVSKIIAPLDSCQLIINSTRKLFAPSQALAGPNAISRAWALLKFLSVNLPICELGILENSPSSLCSIFAHSISILTGFGINLAFEHEAKEFYKDWRSSLTPGSNP